MLISNRFIWYFIFCHKNWVDSFCSIFVGLFLFHLYQSNKQSHIVILKIQLLCNLFISCQESLELLTVKNSPKQWFTIFFKICKHNFVTLKENIFVIFQFSFSFANKNIYCKIIICLINHKKKCIPFFELIYDLCIFYYIFWILRREKPSFFYFTSWYLESGTTC